MTHSKPRFRVALATTQDDFIAAQQLRYDVFVDELGGAGPMVDHEARLERDEFDPYFDHLLLFDDARTSGNPVVGVYRLLADHKERDLGRFYSEDEFDLTPLRRSGRKLLELGRSCVHADYRGGSAMMHLWQGLADYVARHEIEILFGVASFHGTDIADIAPALSLLHHKHRATQSLRPHAIGADAIDMNILPYESIDRKSAMLKVPALIKAYLRLGGMVGQGAFVDHVFNTTDVCLVLDKAQMNEKQRQIYDRA